MKILKYWGPVIFWMLVIFYFSSRSRVQISPEYWLNFLFFKTLHLIEYAFLFTLTYRATKYSLNWLLKAKTALSFLIVVAYAAADEFHQLFVPTREGAVRDVIIDALGATIAWLVLTKLLPKLPRELRTLAKNWQLG